jgi:16S rRNA (cytosine967-C5)-methyltransferase
MNEAINPRRAALEVLIKLDKQRSNSSLLLQETLRKVADPGHRGLITDLVLGTLRWRGRLRFLIQSFSKRSIDRLDQAIGLILQLGLYQLLYTDVPHHAVIHETVELCRKMKLSSAASFVNAILRSVQKQLSNLPEPPDSNPASYLSIRFSHPEWIVRRWMSRLGLEETMLLLEINNQVAPVYIRSNELVGTTSEMVSHLLEEGIRVGATEFGPGILRVLEGVAQKTQSFARGEFYIQDAGVEMLGNSINPQPGSEILEVASAPGGKTFQLAVRMQDQGSIVSVDSDIQRMKIWKENITRLKISCAVPVVLDARSMALQRKFHAVVVDAPCSSLGILRRHPEIKWWREEKDLSSFQKLQLEILSAGASHVRGGGMLFYSVCSFEPEETSHVVERFLIEHAEFQQEQSLTLLPHRDHTDGFFLAAFRQNSD